MDGAAIKTVGLTKRFGGTLALDHLDIEVNRGEIFGFLGPNGAGKTTTIRLLLNLLRPTAGEAWIMGIPARRAERAHRHVAYIPGDVVLWPQLTGAETLEYLGNLSGQTTRRSGTSSSNGSSSTSTAGFARTPRAIGRRSPWSPRS